MTTQSQSVPTPSTHRHETIILYDTMAGKGYRLDRSEPYYTFYERLNKLNTGRWNGKWRFEPRERMIDRMNILEVITSQLELTTSQKNWVKPRFKRIDLRPYNMIGGIYIVVFCICALACDIDGRKYHPSRSPENNDPEFVWFANSVGFADKHLHKVYGKIRAEIIE